jgi:RNA polymerase sigma factor (TIGR02999 family)
VQRRRWHGDDTLNTTALLHEAYLKLADQADPHWESRTHLRRVVAKAMRQILIDYSLAQRTTKRGGERLRVSFDELRATGSSGEFSSQDAEALIALNESLNRLSKLDDRQSQVVECRFFGGMTIPETAETLGTSPATVERDWAIAKAWLYRDMQQTPGL